MSVQVPVTAQFVDVVNTQQVNADIEFDQRSQSSDESTISFGDVSFKKQHVFSKCEDSAFSFIKKRNHTETFASKVEEINKTKCQRSMDKKVASNRPCEDSEESIIGEEGEEKEGILLLQGSDLLLKKRQGKEIRKGEISMPMTMPMPMPMPEPVSVSQDQDRDRDDRDDRREDDRDRYYYPYPQPYYPLPPLSLDSLRNYDNNSNNNNRSGAAAAAAAPLRADITLKDDHHHHQHHGKHHDHSSCCQDDKKCWIWQCQQQWQQQQQQTTTTPTLTTTQTGTTTTKTTEVKNQVKNASGKMTSKHAYFQATLAKAKDLAKIFGGKVTSDKFSVCKGMFAIRFICQNEHNFFITAEKINDLDLDQIRSSYRTYTQELQRILRKQKENGNSWEQSCQEESHGKAALNLDLDTTCWCPKCVEYFDKCLEIYDDKLLQLVGGLFGGEIIYRCRFVGHTFTIKSLRKHHYQKQFRIECYTCPECAQIAKEMERREAMEREAAIRKQQTEAQRALFDQMKREQGDQQFYYDQAEEKRLLQQQERELNEQAKRMTIQYLDKAKRECVEGQRIASYDQVYLTYKFLLTPSDLLTKGMVKRSEQEVKKFYHKIAIQLHPDKNCHPQAKEVFQKVQNSFSEANKLRVN